MRIATGALAACSVLLTAATDGAPPRGSLEAQVLERINEARQDPRGFAQVLRDYRRSFDGRVAYSPERPNGVITSEGPDAVDEAIAFLERQQPLPPLGAGQVLALAAHDQRVAAAVPEARSTTSWGTPSVDVAGGVAAQLTALGVRAVERSAVCTLESKDHFSYRRDRVTGRLAGYVWLDGS